jgi:hypothetical protein
MRRTGLRVACASLLALAVVPVAARALPPEIPLSLQPTDEHYVEIVQHGAGEPGRMWGYWGKLSKTTSANPTGRWGSYRATCVWIADSSWTANEPTKRDNRFFCTVILSFRTLAGVPGAPHGGSIVAQGLMRLPHVNSGLFADASHPGGMRRPPKLAITGATGPYKSVVQGHVDVSSAGFIAIRSP